MNNITNLALSHFTEKDIEQAVLKLRDEFNDKLTAILKVAQNASDTKGITKYFLSKQSIESIDRLVEYGANPEDIDRLLDNTTPDEIEGTDEFLSDAVEFISANPLKLEDVRVVFDAAPTTDWADTMKALEELAEEGSDYSSSDDESDSD